MGLPNLPIHDHRKYNFSLEGKKNSHDRNIAAFFNPKPLKNWLQDRFPFEYIQEVFFNCIFPKFKKLSNAEKKQLKNCLSNAHYCSYDVCVILFNKPCIAFMFIVINHTSDLPVMEKPG
jgi:hypothetical protein